MPLTDQEMRAAHAVVSAWRNASEQVLACPRCGAEGIAVEDRSARPHMEWYAINCAACGLDEALAIPLGSPPPSLDS
jgi:transcription elongation factor Elf1